MTKLDIETAGHCPGGFRVAWLQASREIKKPVRLLNICRSRICLTSKVENFKR